MKEEPFIVASEKAIGALPVWLSRLGCNTCSYSNENCINIGRQFGRKYSYVASIIIRDRSLFDRTLETIKSAVTRPQHVSPQGPDNKEGRA